MISELQPQAKKDGIEQELKDLRKQYETLSADAYEKRRKAQAASLELQRYRTNLESQNAQRRNAELDSSQQETLDKLEKTAAFWFDAATSEEDQASGIERKIGLLEEELREISGTQAPIEMMKKTGAADGFKSVTEVVLERMAQRAKEDRKAAELEFSKANPELSCRDVVLAVSKKRPELYLDR